MTSDKLERGLPGSPSGAAVAATGRVTRGQLFFLFLICVAICLDYLDRYLLSGIVETVKKDIALSDSQIGFLNGPAFALTYCAFAVPFGRLADRHKRVLVLAGAMVLWSAGVLVTAISHSMSGLVVARLLIGAGEAGALAPAHAMIADLFPPHHRGRAMAAVGFACSLGSALAFPLGGALTVMVGWRGACSAIAFFGMATAAMLILFLREPVRGSSEGRAVAIARGEKLVQVARVLLGRRAYRHLILALSFIAMAEYGVQMWIAPLFARRLALPIDEVGALVFLHVGIPTIIGVVAGGWLIDRLIVRDFRWAFWASGGATFAGALFFLALPLISDGYAALAFASIPAFLSIMYNAPAFALIQGLASVRSRAVATSIVVLAVNLVGAGLGPLLIGGLSQLLTKRYGTDALNYAFLAIPPIYVIGAIFFHSAARTAVADIADAAAD